MSTTIYRLKISLSDERGRPGIIWRIVEIPASATLKQLHKLIFDVFEREDDHMWSFFFGKLWKKDTTEYTCSAARNYTYSTSTKSGSSVRLSSLPFKTAKEIHYLFDFGDEWWHRIEFLGEAFTDPKITYPRLVMHQGDSPPQYEDEPLEMIELLTTGQKDLNGISINMADTITYEDIVQTLIICQSPLSAEGVIGLLLGILASPYPVVPSHYLSIVFGEHQFADVAEINRVVSSLMNLHNLIDRSIMTQTPFILNSIYPETIDGLSAQVKALRERIIWFIRGLDIGGADVDALMKKQRFNFNELAKIDIILEELEDLVCQKKHTAKVSLILIEFQQQITQLNQIVSYILMDICITTRGLSHLQ